MTTFIQSREEFERLLVTMNREGWSKCLTFIDTEGPR